ncbi:MAG TPA: DUF4232 domain-containing protein [Mycobacteriales bacterium]|nr:DUF4232 domain-containing protein [Mycobacteriales bacterium]
MRAALPAVAAVALLVAGCSHHPAQNDTASGPVVTSGASGTAGTGGGAVSEPGDGSGQTGSGRPPGADTGPGAAPVSDGPTASTGPARCHTADLAAVLRPRDAAAGNRYATLVLTNHTSTTCRVYGYGGLGLLDAAHRALPTRQHRDPAHPPTLVAVRPGHSVSTLLHWGAVPDGSESESGPCEPQPSFLSVIPPDETTALVVRWQDGSVCEHGRIDQWAYQAGVVAP